MTVRILGTGSALPQTTVTNDDLSKIMDTSDEWIRTRTGIGTRHLAKEETTASLSVEAACRALENSGVSAQELDFIIVGTVTGDNITPSCACTVQAALGADRAAAFDINAACSGFLFALNMAQAYIQAGVYSNALVIGAEILSKMMDWKDRSTCVLFGDGSAAMVLKKGEGRLAGVLSTDPDSHVIRMPNIEGINSPYNQIGQEKLAMHMDGGEVYKFAVNAMGKKIEEVCAMANLAPADIDWYLPHQANARIIEASRKKFHIEREKVLLNISEYGNMSATSILVLLDECAKKGTFKKGDKLLFVAFGGGLTSGAVIIKWKKE